MASDGHDGWPADDGVGDGPQILTTTLAEPAIFYDPETLDATGSVVAPHSSTPAGAPSGSEQGDVPAPASITPSDGPLTRATPAQPDPAVADNSSASALPGDLYASLEHGADTTNETLAELARMGTPTTPLRALTPERAQAVQQEARAPEGEDLWASLVESAEPGPTVPTASGVHALRSLLLGHGPDYEARLELVEQRLEQLALYVTAEVQLARSDAAKVPDLGRRIEALAARVEDALDLARGGDTSLHTLSTLQRQVEELRTEHSELADGIENRMRALETRTRLRQHQSRTAQRMELLRLRARVYRPPETLGSSRTRAMEQQAYERALSAAGGSDLAGPALYAVRQGDDAGAAWRVFSHGIVVFFGALLTLLVVLARVTGEHLRDAWDHLMALFGRD